MNGVVQIVDDDPAVRDALVWIFKSRGVDSVTWDSATRFLDGYRDCDKGCLVLDVRMPEMSGIELFDRLRQRGCTLPVIFLTGHGDVPLAVQAIKDGAFDFLEKPFDDNAMVDRVLAALRLHEASTAAASRKEELRTALNHLTAREREVMDLVLVGKLNKVIADELGIAMRTVEVHRARIFEKMGVRSAVELSQLLASL